MTYTPRIGDVVRYDTLSRPNRWCREGTAIAVQNRGGDTILLDTFWNGGSDQHVLTDDETATAEVQFNVNDFTEIDRWRDDSTTWATYAPADRQIITSQHGLQKRWFIRTGAEPDWPTQIDNARQKVTEREDAVKSAERALEWARDDLARVEADAKAALA